MEQHQWPTEKHSQIDITKFLDDISTANEYDELSKEFFDQNTYNVEMIPYVKNIQKQKDVSSLQNVQERAQIN